MQYESNNLELETRIGGKYTQTCVAPFLLEIQIKRESSCWYVVIAAFKAIAIIIIIIVL